MDRLTLADKILDHLNLELDQLPNYLFTDENKEYKLEFPDEKKLALFNEDTLFSLKTVRFLKDFSRYGSGYDLNTTNESFVRTALLFKKMGIKNYYFCLQLNNPMLAGIDPWDEDLSTEYKNMIMQECNENIWYILREIIKIDGRRFLANRANISFIWCCLCHIPTTILLPRQVGKYCPNDTPIRIPGGKWTTHGEVRPGDTVITQDGSETLVKNIYPQGMKDVYEVTFVDGRVIKAGGDHLWSVYDPWLSAGTSPEGKKLSGRWTVMDTLSIMNKLPKLKRGNNSLYVPRAEPEDQPFKPLPVDPYVLGVLIGDGTLSTYGSVSYTKPDLELLERVNKRLPPEYIAVMRGDGKSVGIIRSNHYIDDQHVRMYDLVEETGLTGCLAHTKFIPQMYKEGNHWQRLNLLRGLMDTDGDVGKNGSVTYNTSSEQLAKDVQWLVWSLGGIANISWKDEPKYTYKGQTFIGKKAYRVHIRHQYPETLMFASKKVERLIGKERCRIFNNKIGIESVVKLDKQEECTCIEVEHPSHLYVTDNFIVTHNTVGMQVMAFILQYIIGRGYKCGLITLASSNRQQFVNAVKKIRSGVPEYLINLSYKDKDSGNLMTYEAFGEDKKNIFEIRVPNGGEDGAENVARGSTFGTLLRDEPAWMKYIDNIISGSGPSTLTEQKNMLEKGMPWFTAQATTPNSVLKPEGAYMYNDVLESTEWREDFFDSFCESHLFARLIKQSPKPNVLFPKVVMQYTHLQLGFGDGWIRRTMDKLNLSWAKAKIDLLMMWTEEGINKIFDDKTRELLMSMKQEHVKHEEIKRTGLFVDWFYFPDQLNNWFNDPNEFFFIGVDTSDALGGDRDACTLTIRRGRNGEVVGTGRYSLAFISDVRDVILEMLLRIPNSLLIIERNRAQNIIDDLLQILPAKGIDPFERIYNEIYNDPVKYATEYRDVTNTRPGSRTEQFYLRYKGRFGFYTNQTSRNQLYMLIYQAVMETGIGIKYGLLIDELIGLQTDKDGRIDHVVKGHDDIVISWLLSYWFLIHGRNKHLYNIPTDKLRIEITPLSDEKREGQQFTKEQLVFLNGIRDKINELTKTLLNTDSDMLAPRLEGKIRELGLKLPPEMNKVITIDELLENTKQERQKRLLAKRKKALSGR